MTSPGFPHDLVITCKSRRQANEVFDLLEQCFHLPIVYALRELGDSSWQTGCVLIQSSIVTFAFKSNCARYIDSVIPAELLLD